MRTFTLTLMQNTGNGGLGASIDLSSKIVDLGAIRWEVDEQLTKLSPGDFSPKIEDHDGSVWAWILSNAPYASAHFPLFIALAIDGTRRFTGTVPLDRIKRDQKTGILTLASQDWSAMLSAESLEGWVRPSPKATTNRAAWPPQTGNSTYATFLGGGWSGANVICFPEPMNWMIAGDILDAVTLDGTFVLKVMLIEHNVMDGFSWNFGEGIQTCRVTVDSAFWGKFYNYALEHYTGTFTRRASTLDGKDYYQVTQASSTDSDNPDRFIQLDTVDGITAGDNLNLIGSTRSSAWDIIQVDAASKRVITSSDVTELAIGDHLFFSSKSLAEVVFEDMRTVMTLAARPFNVRFDRYTPPVMLLPMLIWLPLRPFAGADLTSIRDIEAGLTNLRVFGSGTIGWDGTPEAGWTEAGASVGTTYRAYWTNQRTTTPSSLMTDRTEQKSPASPRRYRITDTRFSARDRDPEDALRGTDPGTWTPTTVPPQVAYDYLLMREIMVTGNAAAICAWSGSAYGTATNVTLPNNTNVRSISVFPGGTAGMLLYVGDAGLCGVVLPGLTSATNVLSLTTSQMDGKLVTTPWGAYLVSSRGYGKITIAGTTLSMAWVDLLAADDGAIAPSTFAGIDSNYVTVIARMDAMDKEGKKTTETHLLLLRATPTTSDTSMVLNEKIMEGTPVTAGLLRDPSQSNRAIGHCGGRLFQVSATLPLAYALERFSPGNMTAAEVLEHVCQAVQAVVVPDAQGTVWVVSRGYGTATAFTVDQVTVNDTKAWQHFYSWIRVTGAESGLLYDAQSAVNGGRYLEISQHPMIWSNSGCAAMAESYITWFGRPRKHQEQTWFYADADAAAPWESVIPMAKLIVNGDATTRILMSLEWEPAKGTAKATLVEA